MIAPPAGGVRGAVARQAAKQARTTARRKGAAALTATIRGTATRRSVWGELGEAASGAERLARARESIQREQEDTAALFASQLANYDYQLGGGGGLGSKLARSRPVPGRGGETPRGERMAEMTRTVGRFRGELNAYLTRI